MRTTTAEQSSSAGMGGSSRSETAAAAASTWNRCSLGSSSQPWQLLPRTFHPRSSCSPTYAASRHWRVCHAMCHDSHDMLTAELEVQAYVCNTRRVGEVPGGRLSANRVFS